MAIIPAPSPLWQHGWQGRMKWLHRYIEQKGKCAICRKPCEPFEMTIDHITPRAKGGKSDWENNLQLCCEKCNSAKGDK